MKWRDTFASLDWIIIACALLLVLVGLAMFFSGTEVPGTVSGLFIRQAAVAGIGCIVLIIVSQLPYHNLKRSTPALYILGVTALLAVSASGRIIRGTVSRFEVAGFQIQPSEFMKIVLMMMLAWLFSRSKLMSPKLFITTLVLVMMPAAIVMGEPDFGMAALMVGIWAGYMLFLGLPWRIIFLLGILASLIGVGAWQLVLFDYQKARIVSFLNPAKDPLGAGYNVSQSIVALGSGQFFGRGLGHGPQSQLKFLPERHTDFILASIGEELGFVGVVVVIGLYAVMLIRILNIARGTSDRFGQLIAIGAFWILLPSLFISAGMNMGILPVTGIPLSLVSYGGSNLLATCILLGLVESVRTHSQFTRSAPVEISYVN